MKRTIVTVLAASLAVSATLSAAWVRAPFVRGDANRDSVVDTSDAVTVLQYLFVGTQEVDSNCLAASDANGDNTVDISDPVYVLNYLYLGGPEPVAPFPEEGLAPDDAGLGCEVYELDAPQDPVTPPIGDTFWFMDNSWGNGWSPYSFGGFGV